MAIVTTDPNNMLSWIHNKPAASETPRMPFLVPAHLEKDWIDPDTPPKEAQQMILPFPDDELASYTVLRLRGKAYPGNVPEIQQPENYDDLPIPGDWGSSDS